MMKLKCLIVVVMCLVVSNADENEKKDHNGEEHKALCKLLKAAVGKWGDGGKHLSGPLQKALAKTIFGKQSSVETVESLKGKLPDDYNSVLKVSDSRNMACGQQPNDAGDYHNVHQIRWSGYSAPHDLVCLCTTGMDGLPLNNSDTQDTLCGQEKDVLKASTGDKGWTNTQDKGKQQIEATWKSVTAPCLEGADKEGLQEALEDFLKKLQQKPEKDVTQNRYLLGESNITETDSNACTGSPKYGVCVAYFNSTKITKTMPWWTELQNAIPEEEKFQEEKKKLEEEERRKQQEEAEKQDPLKTDALTSAHTTTNKTDQHRNDNITDTIRKFNMKSSTPISMPSSWLLSAVFLF